MNEKLTVTHVVKANWLLTSLLAAATLTLVGIFFMMTLLVGINLFGREAVLAMLENARQAILTQLEDWASDDALASTPEMESWSWAKNGNKWQNDIPEAVLEEIEMVPYDATQPMWIEWMDSVTFFHNYNFKRDALREGQSINKNENEKFVWVEPIQHTFNYDGNIIRHVSWNLGVWGQSEVITLTHASIDGGRIIWGNNFIDVPYGNVIEIESCNESAQFYVTEDGLIHFIESQSYGSENFHSVSIFMCYDAIDVVVTDYNQPIPFGIMDFEMNQYEHRWALPLGCLEFGVSGQCWSQYPE